VGLQGAEGLDAAGPGGAGQTPGHGVESDRNERNEEQDSGN